ncbi:OmpA family protein [Histidinibacterium aquaticum]|nr:OmpA family protein [Histidinibacterium aquaticum]
MKPILLTAALLVAAPALAQSPQSYPDGKGGEVTLPLGDLSFADEVTGYEMGEPSPIESARDPAAGLGPPDYAELGDDRAHITLGCEGRVTYRFTDNALIDIEGPDLHVFEVGEDVEGTLVEISQDGERWIPLGTIEGGRADVDIAEADGVEPGESFSLVRLIDDGVLCQNRWPGADIDAVAAIGSAERLVLDGAVLFAFDSADLTEAARTSLRDLVAPLGERDIGAIRVVGHTDAQGSEAYNRDLSQERAEAVQDWLRTEASLDTPVTARGAGEAEPVATNDTEEGRSRNRRVEIIVVPAG